MSRCVLPVKCSWLRTAAHLLSKETGRKEGQERRERKRTKGKRREMGIRERG